MKIFDLTNVEDNGEMIIHLKNDNSNYTVTYDHGQMIFENAEFKYIIPSEKGDTLKFKNPDRGTGEQKYKLTNMRALYRDTNPTDFGISDILDVEPSSSHFTEEIVVGGINESVSVVAPNGVIIYVNDVIVNSGSMVENGDRVKFEITAPSDPSSNNIVLSVGDISKSFNIRSVILNGEESYVVPGSYTWICPVGITSVSTVCIGGGAGGGGIGSYQGSGGGLGWKNNITVVPGQAYNVVVGDGGSSSQNGFPGGNSYFMNSSVVAGLGGSCGAFSITGTYVGDGGGNGGKGGYTGDVWGGAGGAGGYSGNGGDGGNNNSNAESGQGGGGGGARHYGHGGGVGLFGKGTSGAAGNATNHHNGYPGSGGTNGFYGGGGGQGGGIGNNGAPGAVRIMWGDRNDSLASFPNNASEI